MKALLLLSGGIDSPAAGHLMQKKGIKLKAAYFDNYPYSGEDTKKRAIRSAHNLGLDKITIIPHGPTLTEYARNCERKHQCVFCRRMMYRVAAKICEQENLDAILTGENLAQVASQTMENLYTISQATSFPVLRPLIGMDKNDIIRIAKRAGTYDTSITPALCCTITPNRPSTRSKLESILIEESKIDINALGARTLEGACSIKAGQ